MGWPTIGGEGDGVSNWTSSGVIGERSIEDEKVSLVDGVLEGALGALGFGNGGSSGFRETVAKSRRYLVKGRIKYCFTRVCL
ncbi:hypothetical protein Tco_0061629, partial [Tanacetum coccineum]